MAEVLGERAYLGLLLPFRIWRHLARLTWAKVGYECVWVCVSRAEQSCQGPLDMVCSSTFKCPAPARMWQEQGLARIIAKG